MTARTGVPCRRPLALVGVCAALVATLGACGSSVEATAPVHAASPACARAAQHWPRTVADQDRRDTTSSSAAVAAWGDPAIIARCGLSPIGPTTDPCIDANGVGWVAHRLSDGVRFISFGRDPAIEVLVPHAYAPEPLVMSAFAKAARAIPATGRHCT